MKFNLIFNMTLNILLLFSNLFTHFIFYFIIIYIHVKNPTWSSLGAHYSIFTRHQHWYGLFLDTERGDNMNNKKKQSG